MELITAMGVMLDALGEELTRDGSKEDMCLFTVMPGTDVPIDYAIEDCAGMAWVRLVSAAPTVNFPAADLSASNCAYSLAYVFEMGVLRTAPMMTQFGSEFTPPSPEEQFEASSAQFKDLEAMHRALKIAGPDFPDFILGGYTPSGPDGGAVGGVWTATVGLV